MANWDNWSKPITGIKIQGYLHPHSCTDRRQTTIQCLKAEADEIIVQIGDKQYTTNTPGYENYNTIGQALVQICGETLVSTDDETNEWSGYLHNYKFANGRIYGEEDPIQGYEISG